MKIKICVVTSTRADYGILSGLLKKLSLDDEFELRIVATGMHLKEEFGNTYKEIEKDGLVIDDMIDILEKGDSERAVSKTMARAMDSFSRYFERRRPDALLILGDRTEMLSVATAALVANIPIVHLHGGELTEGAVDDAIRHSITKMSSLHLVCAEEYRKRVIQMGENPDMVYNVGAMGVENAVKLLKFTEDEVREKLCVRDGRPYVIVTFHPETKSILEAMVMLQGLLKAMKANDQFEYIITKANSDAGGRALNEIWENECKVNENWHLFASLGMKLYLSAVAYADFVMGNSSSAILEVPAFKIASVDIGNRQKGRIMAESVLHCENDYESIMHAMKEAHNGKLEGRYENVKNPFSGGDTSERILEILKEKLRNNELTSRKTFYDLK